MSISAIREGVARDSIFSCPDDRKSYEHIRKEIQSVGRIFRLTEFSIQIAVITEEQRKYIRKYHLSPSALSHLREQIDKNGLDSECSVVGDLRVKYRLFEPNVYVKVYQLRIKVPKVPKDESGYLSDGWESDFKASKIKSRAELTLEERVKFREDTSVKNPMHHSKCYKK